MVINYKQLREKRDQVKESFRRNEDLTPLVRIPRALLMLINLSGAAITSIEQDARR